ncbi:hypothetical protein [Desulfopila sp. IMCC35008]|uniref:hypothetical protein n=1 Tax=Desulfopila sp. IMCC35008 TaxID=2653858 RepID=UPI0013D5B680|nr:hypothetical protein [Desulfopila sp. IMCC35008]
MMQRIFSCLKFRFFLYLLLGIGQACGPTFSTADEFSFDVEEFEKKSFEAGGYAEFKWEQINLNEQGVLALLNRYDDPVDQVDRLSASLQLNGSYVKDIVSLNWLLSASGYYTEDEWDDYTDVFEAYASLKPTNHINGSFGKKSYKWGKGYAWNPVGFINRMKDPNNPDEALEGYITAEGEIIRSYAGDLQTLALTTVILPVSENVNEDFGQQDNLNLGAKLYLLYLDTDIDLLFYTGDSRSTRFGIDFSRNITTNFEIHGEYAYFSDLEKVYLEEGRDSYKIQDAAHSVLLGFRYLNEFNLTSIIEYYHNGAGYSSEELDMFYSMVTMGEAQYSESGSDDILRRAIKLGQQGYTRPFLGTDYIYARFSLKEPGDILYFTPALTMIYNLDDQSYSITPELLYTGITNWEIRLRFSILGGGENSEYGEKMNQNKIELRLRWFF